MSEGVTPGGPRQSNDRLLPSNFVLILSVVYTCTSTCWFCFVEWNGMEEILLARKFIFDNFKSIIFLRYVPLLFILFRY